MQMPHSHRQKTSPAITDVCCPALDNWTMDHEKAPVITFKLDLQDCLQLGLEEMELWVRQGEVFELIVLENKILKEESLSYVWLQWPYANANAKKFPH